jgi:S-adenosylmethionine:tRNA ribosyltransferase-isomerase
MLLSDFDFPFDPTLVAERPVDPRDRARLLVFDRATDVVAHRHVADLALLLSPGDLVVVNDTRVMPVRLTGRKRPGGGKVDVVLLRAIAEDIWEALLKGGGRIGQVIEFDAETSCRVLDSGPEGSRLQIVSGRPLRERLAQLGTMPLPPYIKRPPEPGDAEWYQTVFARSEGAIAAPTAGLHFTEALLARLRERRIGVAPITLHVGPGTFRPVRVSRIEDHRMVPEHIEVPGSTAELISQTKASGGRIVAVGTTVVRTLEWVAGHDGTVSAYSGETTLFVSPGYDFRVVDAVLTNFHLPRTTLLMLVSAFAGIGPLKELYAEAVKQRYRFYSYGDAMLIL